MVKKKDPPSDRTLEKNVPNLREFLKSGMKILDVGCGPGTITADVACVVSPGQVVSLNTRTEDDQAARAWAKEFGVGENTSFLIGDSHNLAFEDNSFDLVYSYTAAHFFIDPVKALKEQARVTKENGYVVAAGVRDIGPRYPRCENWEKVWEAWIRFSDSIREEYRNSGADPVVTLQDHIAHSDDYTYHYDIQAGRKCVEWLSKAGLVDISISAEIAGLRYPEENLMTPKIVDLIEFADMDEDKREVIRRYHSRMIESGFIDKGTIEAAEKEAAAWIENPYAMNYWVRVFASGRVGRE